MAGPAQTILLIEADRQIRSALRQGLEAEHFAVVDVQSRQDIFDCIAQQPIDLIALEIDGGDSALDLPREIRNVLNVPILIITGWREAIDRLAILENGADDYVTKPFHVREVVLRIRALLRRYNGGVEIAADEPAVYPFEDIILDTRKRELRRKRDNSVIEITETEFKILELFLRHPARVLSRDEITQALRGHDWSPTDRTIDGHISRLRRKIEAGSNEPRLIKSVRGVGYVFCG